MARWLGGTGHGGAGIGVPGEQGACSFGTGSTQRAGQRALEPGCAAAGQGRAGGRQGPLVRNDTQWWASSRTAGSIGAAEWANIRAALQARGQAIEQETDGQGNAGQGGAGP